MSPRWLVALALAALFGIAAESPAPGGEHTGFCAPPVQLGKKAQKKLEKREAQVASLEEKIAALSVQAEAAEAALAEAQAELAAALQLPEETPEQQKAKKKAIKAAKAAIQYAEDWVEEVAKKSAKREKKRSKKIDQVLALDPGAYLRFAPEPEGTSPFDPPWAGAPVLREIVLEFDPELSVEENGLRLRDAIAALEPGDRLLVGGGTWSVAPLFVITAQGTPEAPIRIEAREGEHVVLTRPDAYENVLNLGTLTPGSVRYLLLRGIEVTGGSAGIRIYGGSHVWIDRCHIHHTAEAALTANTVDTDHLYLTRNEIHHTGGYGEGMYLGANGGAVVMRESVIARNHVYETGDVQGDGIEVKQGSWGNWIVENCIHDTNYPCILVYGTNGNPVNVIERNVCIGSADNVMQVQGEAVVRDNLIVGGVVGFYSHDHQGLTRDLTFVHNTVINSGVGAFLKSWTGRPGMVFANNVVFSKSSASVVFQGGASGVQVAGNVFYGEPWGLEEGWAPADGLDDFFHASWDGAQWLFFPRFDAAWKGSGDPAFSSPVDLAGRPRGGSPTPGCLEGASPP